MTGSSGRRYAQVVLIAGASSGIGMQTALRYAQRQARLVLLSRDIDKLGEVAAQCRTAGAADVTVVACDIGQGGLVKDAFDRAADQYGHIDIVAQCAAVTAFGRFDSIPTEVFDKIVSTNLIGAANIARSALAQFDTQGYGQLVVVGSLLGTTAVPYQSAYVASKFAVNGLVRTLQQENRANAGIKIHGIYPGPVDTPVYGNAANFLGRTPRTPLAASSPDSIADAILRATDLRRSGERQVGVVNKPAITFYRLLPSLFDRLITPLLHLTAFRARPPVETTGNVFGPQG